jgi:hypothetical protein
MKRSPMPRRRRTKHQEANMDHAEYRAWLATQPCCLCGIEGVQLAHVGVGGMGLKHGDDDCMVPLCPHCHRDHDSTDGVFRRPKWFPKDPWRQAMREWDEIQIAAHRGRFEARNVANEDMAF